MQTLNPPQFRNPEQLLSSKSFLHRAPWVLVLTLLVAVLSGSVAGAQFSSGSDGSDGALDVTTGTVTLDLPPNGIFHYTTINVAAGATLEFNRNALNTPVYLLATGDVLVAGTIDVSGSAGTSSPPRGGLGGPGGFDGGAPGFGGQAPGAGHGPGGGQGGSNTSSSTDVNGAGAGAYGSRPSSAGSNDGVTYGSPLLVPLVGGSGGGGTTGSPGKAGGGGGGAVLVASNTRIEITGRIYARGGIRSGNWNGGSGGAIRLVSPIVTGNGTLDVNEAPSSSSAGGDGRMRIDTLDTSGLVLTASPVARLSAGSFMVVFPEPMPRLDITSAAGQAIAEGTPGPVEILLPTGSPTTQQVVVQARNFSGLVDIDVVLTPESGDVVTFPAQIDASTNPATITVDVEMPINVVTRIYAWTR